MMSKPATQIVTATNSRIAETETAPASAEKKDMAAFVKYTETQLPVGQR